MISAWTMLLLNALCVPLRLENPGSFPRPLKPEEERMYLERYAAGDLEARNKLVEHNLRLVSHILKKYYVQSSDQDDLISIGTIGLIKGVSTYQMDKKVRLATYCSKCIQNEILMYFRAQRKFQGDVSLSDAIESDREGDSLSLMDVIKVDDDLMENLDAKDARAKVRQCVERCLTPRELDVITRRYGLDGKEPRTQREVAAQWGISRSYVSRIEKKALEKLRTAMEEPV